MAGDLIKVLERLAEGVEALAAEQEVEIKSLPPVCPHCGAFDPRVTIAPQEGGEGKMSEIVVDARCNACGNRVFIVIDSYSTHREVETVAMELSERERAGYFKQ